MLKYSFTSPKFPGEITFGYSPVNNLLVSFDNRAELTDEQHIWLLKDLPKTLEHLNALSGKLGGKLVLVPADLSFNAFWEEYGKKVHKKRTEPLWNKLSEAERIQCLMSIKPYKAYLKRTNFRAQLDPYNYISYGSYETNWNKER